MKIEDISSGFISLSSRRPTSDLYKVLLESFVLPLVKGEQMTRSETGEGEQPNWMWGDQDSADMLCSTEHGGKVLAQWQGNKIITCREQKTRKHWLVTSEFELSALYGNMQSCLLSNITTETATRNASSGSTRRFVNNSYRVVIWKGWR